MNTKEKIKPYLADKLTGIPKHWNVLKLGQLGSFAKGQGISQSDLVETGCPCVRYGDIYTTHDFVIKEVHSFISQETANQSVRINKGDILFAGSGETLEEIGKAVAYIGTEEAFAGGDVIILTIKAANNVYISYLLNDNLVLWQKRRFGQGHSVVHIYSRDLAEILVPVPPLSEQKKIAEILGCWDSGIEKIEKLISTKQMLKKGLMQQLLIGKKRFKEFKEQEWKKIRLGKYVKLQGGYAFKSSLFQQSGIPIIRISNINNNGIDIESNVAYYQGISLSGSFLVCKGDLLIAMSGATTGKVGTYKKDSVSYLNQRVGKFCVLDMEKLNYEFLAQIVNHSEFKKGLSRDLATGAQPNISSSQVEKIKVLIPICVREQQKIASILNTADREIELLCGRLEALKNQKKGLMQKLLMGKIRFKC